jgi:hypothetical protein
MLRRHPQPIKLIMEPERMEAALQTFHEENLHKPGKILLTIMFKIQIVIWCYCERIRCTENCRSRFRLRSRMLLIAT